MRFLLLLTLACSAPTGTEYRPAFTDALTVDTAIVIGTVDDAPRERVLSCTLSPDTVSVGWGGVEGNEVVERCY